MNQRYQTLDGWRGISILLVLAGHLFPLGFGPVQLNAAVAGSGMAIFFILSGFLITSILIKDQNIKNFLIRRVLRILPLAWLVLLITLLLIKASPHQWFSNLFFYANWPPMGLVKEASHFWSLCLEMQFYILIGVGVLMVGKKALYLCPILALGVTGFRVINNVDMAINTYYRADEILAGCTLALIYHNGSLGFQSLFSRFNPSLLFIALILSAHDDFAPLTYLRPYIAMTLVASTLFQHRQSIYIRTLETRLLKYIATISYALYVIHGGLRYTWLSDGSTIIKYVKRPLFLAVTFVLAHLSTFYYEKYWITLGRRLTGSREKPLTKQPHV